MNLESKKVIIEKSQEELYKYLSDIENYKDLIPQDAEFLLHESKKGFAVQIKGLPKVGLKLKEKEEPNFILFESPSESFKYEMKVIVKEQTENSAEASILFDGKFNPMIEMMAKKPLGNFVETLMNNLEVKFS